MEGKALNPRFKEETGSTKRQTKRKEIEAEQDESKEDSTASTSIEKSILELIRETIETSSYINATDEILEMLGNPMLVDEIIMTFQRVLLKVIKRSTKSSQIEETLWTVRFLRLILEFSLLKFNKLSSLYLIVDIDYCQH